MSGNSAIEKRKLRVEKTHYKCCMDLDVGDMGEVTEVVDEEGNVVPVHLWDGKGP